MDNSHNCVTNSFLAQCASQKKVHAINDKVMEASFSLSARVQWLFHDDLPAWKQVSKERRTMPSASIRASTFIRPGVPLQDCKVACVLAVRLHRPFVELDPSFNSIFLFCTYIKASVAAGGDLGEESSDWEGNDILTLATSESVPVGLNAASCDDLKLFPRMERYLLMVINEFHDWNSSWWYLFKNIYFDGNSKEKSKYCEWIIKIILWK